MAIIAFIDMLIVRRNPARSRRKRSTQGAVASLKEKQVQGLSISKFRSKEGFSAESKRIGIERFGGTHHKILRTHLVRNSCSGKKTAISGRYPKR